MKLLYISNIANESGITNFSMSAQEACHELGIEMHYAKNFSKLSYEKSQNLEKKHRVTLHHIDFKRNPFHLANIRAIYQLVNVIKKEKIDIIHCNTPVGGVCGRIVGLICGIRPVIYQSHGFHFFRRAPLKNWLLYYPAERIMAHWTDFLLTINDEDYENALKFKLRNHGKVFRTLGVGLETEKYSNCIVDKKQYRKNIGVPEDSILLITVGEVAERKNHITLIKALAKLQNDKIFLIICGEGKDMKLLQALSKKYDLDNNVIFLGRREDIPELCNIADIYCFPSKREGMGIAAMEGMAAGLPLISSNIQGIKDYAKQGKTGYVLEYDDVNGFAVAIEKLANNQELRERFGKYNKEFIKKYDRSMCTKCYRQIYESIIEEMKNGNS